VWCRTAAAAAYYFFPLKRKNWSINATNTGIENGEKKRSECVDEKKEKTFFFSSFVFAPFGESRHYIRHAENLLRTKVGLFEVSGFEWRWKRGRSISNNTLA